MVYRMLCWLHSDNTQNDVAQPDGKMLGDKFKLPAATISSPWDS